MGVIETSSRGWAETSGILDSAGEIGPRSLLDKVDAA
jgi:hypothetical protein